MKKLDKLADATPGSMVRLDSSGGRFLVCKPNRWECKSGKDKMCLLVVNWRYGKFGDLEYDSSESDSYSLLEEEDLK